MTRVARLSVVLAAVRAGVVTPEEWRGPGWAVRCIPLQLRMRNAREAVWAYGMVKRPRGLWVRLCAEADTHCIGWRASS